MQGESLELAKPELVRTNFASRLASEWEFQNAMTISGVPLGPVIEQLGPLGGTGGARVPPWSMPLDGAVTFLEVKWGAYLNQVLFHHTSPSGGDGVISLGGLQTCPNHERFYLRDGEVIQAFTVTYGQYVNSVAIVTNEATYGPYGNTTGAAGTLSIPADGTYLGLHGRAGYWIDAFGILYAGPGVIQPPTK